jgi:predicted DNA-binding transcriptional regulator YafY
MLVAWCEARHAFRSFRIDRMVDVHVVEGADSTFRDEPGKTLADFLRMAAPPEVMAKWAQKE